MFGILQKLLGKRTDETPHDARVEKRRLSYCLKPFNAAPSSESSTPAESEGTKPKTETPARTEERRDWERYPCDAEIECHPDVAGGDVHWLGRAADISRGGMELVTERRFERGTFLTIHVKGNADLPGFLARVCHVESSEHQKWVLGCRFLRELTEAEIQDFRQAAQPANPGPASIPA